MKFVKSKVRKKSKLEANKGIDDERVVVELLMFQRQSQDVWRKKKQSTEFFFFKRIQRV